MEEKNKIYELSINKKLFLEQKIEKEIKTISRSIVFYICSISFIIFLFFWIGSVYFWKEFFSLGLFLTISSLILSVVAVISANKLISKESVLGHYLVDLNCEQELLIKMLAKLKNEKRVLESLDPTDIPPYSEVNQIYQEMLQQAKMLKLLVEGGNDQDVAKILEKIHETCSGLAFEDRNSLVPEKHNLLESSPEEKEDKINLFLEELGKKKAVCVDTAARDKKKKLLMAAKKIEEEKAAIEEVSAKMEIIKNQLSIC